MNTSLRTVEIPYGLLFLENLNTSAILVFTYLQACAIRSMAAGTDFMFNGYELSSEYGMPPEMVSDGIQRLIDGGVIQDVTNIEDGDYLFVISRPDLFAVGAFQAARNAMQFSRPAPAVPSPDTPSDAEAEPITPQDAFRATMYLTGITLMSERMLMDAIDYYCSSKQYALKIAQGKARIPSMLRNQVAKVADWRNRDEMLAITPERDRLYCVKDGRLQPKERMIREDDKARKVVREWQDLRSHFENRFMDIGGRHVMIMDREGAFTQDYLDSVKAVSVDQWRAHSRVNASLKAMLGRDCYVPVDAVL